MTNGSQARCTPHLCLVHHPLQDGCRRLQGGVGRLPGRLRAAARGLLLEPVGPLVPLLLALARGGLLQARFQRGLFKAPGGRVETGETERHLA